MEKCKLLARSEHPASSNKDPCKPPQTPAPASKLQIDGGTAALQVLRDQSSYSSWYFIERASIGEINANVTIALTSSVLGGSRQGVAAPQEGSGGLFSRFIGASGFQLINVNNVPLSLGSWSLDTKLLGRKAMINSLARHYFAQGISEAHKVGVDPHIGSRLPRVHLGSLDILRS